MLNAILLQHLTELLCNKIWYSDKYNSTPHPNLIGY